MEQIKAVLKQVSAPQKDCAGTPVGLSDETIAERKQKVLDAMKARGLDQLIVYGDVARRKFRVFSRVFHPL